jgi:glutaredoxin 3
MMACVTVHSKPGCAFCDKAVQLLDDLGVPYRKVVYMPDDGDYAAKRDALFDSNGHGSFPQVFAGDTFIGGFKELRDLRDSGELERLLAGLGVFVADDHF